MAEHNFRDGQREVKNADKDLTATNVQLTLATTSAEALEAVKTRLDGCKRRKDSVEVIEYLVTASPEQFLTGGNLAKDRGRAFFEAAYRDLEAQHGKENVAWATIQFDETTPHLSIGVVPRVETPDGPKLAASKWLNGRKALAAMQDRIAALGERHGLQRGVRGSPAKHETVRRFYGALNATESDPRLQPMKQETLPEVPPAPGFTDKLTSRGAEMERARAKALAERRAAEARNRKAIEHNRERMKLLTQLAGQGLGRRGSQNERAKLVDQAKQADERAALSEETTRDIAKAARARGATIEQLRVELDNQKSAGAKVVESLKGMLEAKTAQAAKLLNTAQTLARELIEASPDRARALGLIKAPEPESSERDNSPGMSGP